MHIISLELLYPLEKNLQEEIYQVTLKIEFYTLICVAANKWKKEILVPAGPGFFIDLTQMRIVFTNFYRSFFYP